MKELKIKELVGTELKTEDAVIVKLEIHKNLSDKIVLNFESIDKVPGGFFANLLTELISTKTREYIATNIDVKNLANMKDFNRVILGTAF